MSRGNFYTLLLALVLAATIVNGVLVFKAIHGNTNTIHRLEHDEEDFISNGVATTTCLLEVFRNVEPTLSRLPRVQRPLHAFLVLQGRRYGEHRCPDLPGEAERLAKRLPRVGGHASSTLTKPPGAPTASTRTTAAVPRRQPAVAPRARRHRSVVPRHPAGRPPAPASPGVAPSAGPASSPTPAVPSAPAPGATPAPESPLPVDLPCIEVLPARLEQLVCEH